MLHRVIYASEAVGTTGGSTLSVAQILGASEPNNRRDHLTSCMMLHRGHILQVIEGGRNDIDRLMQRLLRDPRHTGLRILSDTPIVSRRIELPMILCPDPAAMLDRFGLPCISRVTAPQAESMLEMSLAA
jgi:hypothetical protein|tara:strand:+ start:787 stop:1176 length:390 start_codon:yes stop_codon:yes gene_type:complete